jgi:hypothetical protein
MRFPSDSLPQMAGREYFVQAYCTYVDGVLRQGRLTPVFSRTRIIEAHGAWQNDIHRISEKEKKLEDGLDHFKQAGHLAYWIRRMGPVVETVDTTANFADAPGYPLTEDEKAFRLLMLGYCNEYLAFDLGFQLVKLHEIHPSKPNARASTIRPSADYIQRMCQFMKYKHVSPHALHLIYSSLFAE